MKNNKFVFAAIVISAMVPVLSFAAGANLYNGGFGQSAGNVTQFGVAICNGGAATMTQSVPVSIATNGKTTTISSAASIAPSTCAYSYAPYSSLGMQVGGVYSVAVTIDPTHSVISNTNNQATYSVTVPGGTPAGSAMTKGTADVNAQSGNFFTAIIHWFQNLF